MTLISPRTQTVIGDRYELTGAVIGSGGVGVVYAGHDRVLSRDVAVKILSDHAALNASLRQRFQAEALAVARLSHPNVVAVYDAGVHEDRPYIVMERLPGKTFADELAGKPLPGPRVRRVANDVLGALQCAHDAGIIHRDVKPHNILIAADGSAKLTDFGIAKSLDNDVTKTRDVLGTPAYLAPELFDGARPSAGTDVYGAGVMLYEALAGVKPFAGDTPWAVAAAAKAGLYTPLSEIAASTEPALFDVVERAMASDPEVRFSTAAEMQAAMNAPIETEPRAQSAMETTRVLQVQSPASQSTQIITADPRKGSANRIHPAARHSLSTRLDVGRRGLAKTLAAFALALVVIAGLFLMASGDAKPPAAASQPKASQPAAPASSVPAPLRNGLIELQRSVRP